MVSACAWSRFDCFFRMKAARAAGAATGHIGRSLAERIEWHVRVRCRPRPSLTNQPIKLNLDEAAAPRAAAHGFSLKHQLAVGHRVMATGGERRRRPDDKPVVLPGRHGFQCPQDTAGWCQ